MNAKNTKMGRPIIDINEEDFKKLCEMQCTLIEIAGWFDCSEDTIERWCKRTYCETFADVFKKKSIKGKVSLRRTQFELAKTSAGMAIFLGKQYLGQSDKQELSVDNSSQATLEAYEKAAKVHKDKGG